MADKYRESDDDGRRVVDSYNAPTFFYFTSSTRKRSTYKYLRNKTRDGHLERLH